MKNLFQISIESEGSYHPEGLTQVLPLNGYPERQNYPGGFLKRKMPVMLNVGPYSVGKFLFLMGIQGFETGNSIHKIVAEIK